MILVDTSVWVEFFRRSGSRHDTTLTRIIESGDELATTGLILTEILQGLRSERELRMARGLLLRLPLLEPSSLFTYVRAADLFRACRSRGLTLRSTVDCIVAAICIEHGLELLHNDADYTRIARVSELKEYPT